MHFLSATMTREDFIAFGTHQGFRASEVEKICKSMGWEQGEKKVAAVLTRLMRAVKDTNNETFKEA